MNIINRIKLQTQYSDLKKMGIDSELLEKVITDKQFAESYKKEIKPFIKYLQDYSSQDYNNVPPIEKKLDAETINYHINSILKTYKGNDSIKYISFIKNNFLEKHKLKNSQVLNDNNFDTLFKLIGHDVFNDNLSSIINSGYSQRLLQFIEKNPKINLSSINSNIFTDSVWKIINSNPKMRGTTILDLFGNGMSGLNILVGIIQNGLFEGLKYTYENIPESHNFILYQLGTRIEGTLSFEQFDINFIKYIGHDVLNKLYYRNCFSDKNEFSKIFKISQSGNYELIQDIVNYDTYNFSFKNISDEDITKNLLNSNIGGYNKKEVLLNKYFGIERNDNHYIKLFLSSINKAKLTDEFKEKYETILTLLNQIYNASDEEIISISEKLNKDRKEEYHKLIYDCEKDGNELIKGQFSEDLMRKSNEILSVATHTTLATNGGKTIDVYKLTGQQFTMLVHAITDNKLSENNSYVSQIVNNPEIWNNINGGNNHISTSLISDKYMVTYGIPNNKNTIMFGFNNIPAHSLKFTSVGDAGINRNAKTNINYNMRNRLFVADINTVVSVDELMQKTIDANIQKQSGRMWNEIGLSRVNEETGEKLQPNYIVCMDYVSESSKKAAEYFGIPIYLIQRKYYKELPYVSENNLTDQVQEEKYGNTGIHR